MEMSIDRVGISWVPSEQIPAGHFVLLKSQDGNHFLCIFIGRAEAEGIIAGLAGFKHPRPLTHDLLSAVLKSTDAVLDRVEVSALEKSTFLGKLVTKRDGETAGIDARPSDALALASRHGCPIIVSDEVVERAGLTPEQVAQEPAGVSTLWPFSG